MNFINETFLNALKFVPNFYISDFETDFGTNVVYNKENLKVSDPFRFDFTVDTNREFDKSKLTKKTYQNMSGAVQDPLMKDTARYKIQKTGI